MQTLMHAEVGTAWRYICNGDAYACIYICKGGLKDVVDIQWLLSKRQCQYIAQTQQAQQQQLGHGEVLEEWR